MTNEIEIVSTKKAVLQMIETKAEMESMIKEMEVMIQPEAPYKIESDREKVKGLLEKTKNDLINITNEIDYWQNWLKEHAE